MRFPRARLSSCTSNVRSHATGRKWHRRSVVHAAAGVLPWWTSEALAGPPLVQSNEQRTFVPGWAQLAVVVPANSFASVGLFGRRDSLLGLTVGGAGAGARAARTRGALDEDALLPRFVAFGPTEKEELVDIYFEADAGLTVEFAVTQVEAATVPGLSVARGPVVARPLVAFPPPKSDRDGYALQIPLRYAFVRVDVALALRRAFRETTKRFRRDPIYLGDASQWNGIRPKADLGNPRHISHQGGVDIDLAFPASDGTPSTVRDRCQGVLLDPEHWGCAPGTVQAVDFERLAYLLGKLVDDDPLSLTKVFVDDSYRREIARAAEAIYAKKWIGSAARAALSDEGIVVASPWHTDHVHLRFRGEHGRPLFVTGG